MKQFRERLMAHPTVAHLLRANTRFGNRLGNQFAAAITYFSVLAMVPILMFAFSMLGMTLTVLRPEWLDAVKTAVTDRVGGQGGQGKQVSDLIDGFLRNWRGVGVVGLLSALYAGAGWAGNLRSAVRAQWRPEFENDTKATNVFVKTLWNIVVFLILLVASGITFVFSVGGTALANRVAGWLHIASVPGGTFLMRLVALVITLAAAWVLFMMMYRILPQDVAPLAARMKGSAAAAAAFGLLQFGAGLLVGQFSKNAAAALFGPVIILMLFLNLFSRLTLLISAWIATTTQPAVAFQWNDCDAPLRNNPAAETAEDHWARAEEDRLDQQREEQGDAPDDRPRAAATAWRDQQATLRRPRPEPFDPLSVPRPDPALMVPQTVAAKSVSVGTAAGWAVGAATGLGVGALVGRAVGRIRRPRVR